MVVVGRGMWQRVGKVGIHSAFSNHTGYWALLSWSLFSAIHTLLPRRLGGPRPGTSSHSSSDTCAPSMAPGMWIVQLQGSKIWQQERSLLGEDSIPARHVPQTSESCTPSGLSFLNCTQG